MIYFKTIVKHFEIIVQQLETIKRFETNIIIKTSTKLLYLMTHIFK